MAHTLATDLALALDPALLLKVTGIEADPWQARALRSGASRQAWCASRQSGKSSLAAILALHTALYVPGSLVLLLSPSLRQSQELFSKVRDAYRALDTPTPLTAESALRYELVNGSRLIALPGTEGTIRGYSGVDLLIIDEAARVEDELYYAVRPMMAVSGGKLTILSTPWGKRGWFYEAWISDEPWERVKIPATECPRISAEFLAEEQRTLPPMWYASEYECVFGETVNSVFRDEDISEMFNQDVEPLFPLGV